jgi:hypothetical protein
MAVGRLHAHDASAGLRQIFQAHPRLDRLGVERFGEYRRGRERRLAVEAQAGRVALRAAVQLRT